MEYTELSGLWQKSRNIVRYSVYCQVLMLAAVIGILYFKPVNYKVMGWSFSIVGLLLSSTFSRWYIRTGKKIESAKTFTEEKSRLVKREYFQVFFASYVLWVVCACVFLS